MTVPVGEDDTDSENGTGSADGEATSSEATSSAESSTPGRSDLARTGTEAGLLVGLAAALTLTGAGALALRHRAGRR